jgi:hypothetical protein
VVLVTLTCFPELVLPTAFLYTGVAGALELPVAAPRAAARGCSALMRRGGAPGRARRGARHVPDVEARRRLAGAVRPAAERGRADPGRGRGRGHAGRAGAGAARVVGPEGHGAVHRDLPRLRGRALRHAAAGRGARSRAVPAPTPVVPLPDAATGTFFKTFFFCQSNFFKTKRLPSRTDIMHAVEQLHGKQQKVARMPMSSTNL